MSVLAITGGTGFVGRHLIDRALAAGHEVRALTRRPQPDRARTVWIEGALDTPLALAAMLRGAEAVIHVAGVVNAADRAGFAAGNIAGTQSVLDAARTHGVTRFVHVSSLSAREPRLSNYGWSKAEGEHAVARSALDWTIVRPPGIYGPGDMEVRDVFRLARYGLALLPPAGRASWIAVDDLARLLLTLAGTDPGRLVLEPDDGRPGGWTHVEFARAIGVAVGRRVLPLSLARSVLSLGARADATLRGAGAKLTADRVGYLCHPDWVSDPARTPPAALWTPQMPTPDGLAATAAWYRAQHLL